MKTLENEIKGEKVQRLKQENETIKGQLREEKKKSEDLACQVSGCIWRFKIISKQSSITSSDNFLCTSRFLSLCLKLNSFFKILV